MTALMPYQRRQPGESMARWANRLREERGNHDVRWCEDSNGNLYLVSAKAAQSKLDL